METGENRGRSIPVNYGDSVLLRYIMNHHSTMQDLWESRFLPRTVMLTKARQIAIKLIMRDIFSSRTINPVFHISDGHEMPPSSRRTLDGVGAFMARSFKNGVVYNNSDLTIGSRYVEARGGMIATLPAGPKNKLPQLSFGLDDYGNLSKYISSSITSGYGNVMPANPSTMKPHIHVIELVQRRYMRKLRVNVLLERNLFDLPIEGFRMWYSPSSEPDNHVIDHYIMNNIVTPMEVAGLMIVEQKENILDELVDRVLEPSKTILASSVFYLNSNNLMMLKHQI